MLEAMLTALSDLLTVQHLIYMVVGVVIGLSVGIFPGLGGIAGLSLLLPFIYGMDPTSALAMLIGLVAVIPTSDTFASVLMGIPGSSASQATVLDGFPMSRDGHAARALSAAFASSLFGGLLGAAILTGFVLIARPLILLFTSAELFMLSVFGLSMVGVLAGRSLAKGLGACGLGLVLGSVGGAPATGEFRMIFNTDYLYDGVPLVIVGLGLFAVPEIVDLLRRDQAISSEGGLGAGWLDGLRDWWKNIFLSLRCAGLGTIIGAIPGLGGSVVDWLAYGHAMQSEKNTENFGKGDVRGVIAPESANNAKEGGGLLPTLMFGIPGSGSMAVFLGGMVLIGIEPGPSMVTTNLNITYTIIWSLALANVIGAGLCIVLSQPIARLTTIPFPQLAPFMIAVISFAAFQATRSLADLVALLVVGVIGVFMRRFGWPRPALLIGFVLAAQSETYLYQAVQFYGWEFILRPGCLILLAFIVVSVWYGMRNRVDDSAGSELRSDIDELPSTGMGGVRTRLPQILFALFAAAIFLAAFLDSLQHSFLGKVFPMIMALAGLAAVTLLLVQLWTKDNRHNVSQDTEVLGEYANDPEAGSLWAGLLWITFLVALSALIGFFMAMVIFFVVFLIFRARVGPLRVVLLTAGAAAFVLILANALNLRFPDGLLQAYTRLPWPFG
ncbi:TctA family transporter [Palleronia aestuarii]|uniref:TctA family transporter n=1 Tax=Palleronia aestuarii TaxID=568105 RepID=A0A2W7N840_9RHOB|nr:tripartite tricarboxylate transporter permease [Palleronia aestuarii]PZX14367.1 TctA family transporter [Palleronia aestuarii]